MRPGLLTLGLAAGLAACSKPNPLFLDTWEGLSEGASQVDASATTSEPGTSSGTTVDPTTSTTIEETTTGGPTSTSEPTTATSPGSTGPACTATLLDDIAPSNDTFLVRALPSGGPVCPLSGEDETFYKGECSQLEFGQQPELSLFADVDEDGMSPRFGYFLFDFPRDGSGQLLPPGTNVPVPTLAIEAVSLRLVYSNPTATQYDQLVVDLYAIPPELAGEPLDWHEGPSMGDICKDGANLACSACDPNNPPNCSKKWGNKPLDIADMIIQMAKVDTFMLPGAGAEPVTATIDLDRKYFGAEPNRGFVLVPKAIKLDGVDAAAGIPPGPVRMRAEEFSADPNQRINLVVKACLP